MGEVKERNNGKNPSSTICEFNTDIRAIYGRKGGGDKTPGLIGPTGLCLLGFSPTRLISSGSTRGTESFQPWTSVLHPCRRWFWSPRPPWARSSSKPIHEELSPSPNFSTSGSWLLEELLEFASPGNCAYLWGQDTKFKWAGTFLVCLEANLATVCRDRCIFYLCCNEIEWKNVCAHVRECVSEWESESKDREGKRERCQCVIK